VFPFVQWLISMSAMDAANGSALGAGGEDFRRALDGGVCREALALFPDYGQRECKPFDVFIGPI
jgi:hypothetical protein